MSEILDFKNEIITADHVLQALVCLSKFLCSFKCGLTLHAIFVIDPWEQPWNSDCWEFNSVAQLCPTLCDPVDCSTLGFPVHHQQPELAQAHIHRVSDAIQSSHPLSSPSPSTFNLSQHQGLFQWVSSSHQVAKVLGDCRELVHKYWRKADYPVQDMIAWFQERPPQNILHWYIDFFFSCRYLKNSKCKERCLQTLLICLKKMSLTCLKTDPPKKKLQCHEFLPQASYQLGKTDSSQEMKLEVKTTCRQMCHKLSHIVF